MIDSGLTDAEVAERLARGDRNQVELRSSRTYWAILQENVFTTFNLTLGAALATLLVLRSAVDVVFAGGTVFVNIVVGVVQEVRAKRALDKLALLSLQQVTVRRNGVEASIPVDQVVRDDLIVLRPGDRAAVDGPVVEADHLEMDESLLTGEVDPISKASGDEIRSGSFCLAGQGVFRAERIGMESYANRISHTSRAYKRSLTPLQQKINIVVQLFSAGLVVAVFLHFVASLNAGLSALDTLRFGVVIITNSVPAGLVLAVSVSLGLGAVEISRYNTLVQRINAIESMNSVRVLCTDKTGTLTQNKLRVHSLLSLHEMDADALRHLAAAYAALVANRNSSMRALYDFTGPPSIPVEKQAETPFTSARKWGAITLAAVRQDALLQPAGAMAPLQLVPWDGGAAQIAEQNTILVGAPEVLLQGDPAGLEMAQEYSRQGMRVLAMATAPNPVLGEVLPLERQGCGLILLSDALRPDIRQTIQALRQEGIGIKVISGDSIDTVAALAREAGLPVSGGAVYSERDLSELPDSAFDEAARQGVVFGRIVPETKRRLVASLMRQGEYVAMVGDGVNDVPALKTAQLSIGMNDGAQIAKDVSDIVLLNNALSTLPQAFRTGDSIKQKILVATRLYLTKNVMIILAILFVGFIRLPFPINPPQLSLLAMATVSIPTALFAFGILQPIRQDSFLRSVLGYSLLAGAIGALTLTIAYILVFFGGGLRLADVVGLGALTQESYQAMRYREAQTVLTLVALFYGLLIWWEATGISIWRPPTLRQHLLATLAGIFTTAIITAALFADPRLFHAKFPGQAEWSLALFLPVVAHYALRAILASTAPETILRELSRP